MIRVLALDMEIYPLTIILSLLFMVKQLDLFLSDHLSPESSVSSPSTVDPLITSELMPWLASAMRRFCSSSCRINHPCATCPISWLSAKTHSVGILSMAESKTRACKWGRHLGKQLGNSSERQTWSDHMTQRLHVSGSSQANPKRPHKNPACKYSW